MRRIGNLNAKYKTVPANMRRILYRPYAKPPRLFLITVSGVFVLPPESFNREGMLRGGYVKVKAKGRNDMVYERTLK